MAGKVGADKLMAAGCPPQLAAQLSDPDKVGRLIGSGFFLKLVALLKKDGPLVMQLIGPLEAAFTTGDWSALLQLATTQGGGIWQVIQDLFDLFPAPVIPAPPAA